MRTKTKPTEPSMSPDEAAYRAALLRWIRLFKRERGFKPNFVEFRLTEQQAREIERGIGGR